MSLEWLHSEEEVLIDFYAKHECLHNKHHADYNYNRKNKLLAELVKELNRQSAGKKFKVDNVSTHWNQLRNIYNPTQTEGIITEGVTMPDNSNRSQTNFDDVLSPVKTDTKLLAQTTPKVTVTKIKRRATMAPPKELSPSPTKIRRRRSIHALSHNNEVERSPPNSHDDTETEFECEISVTPIAAKGRQKRVSVLSNSSRQLSTTVIEKPTRINSALSSNIVNQQSIASSVEEEHVKPINQKARQRRTVNIQATVMQMEVDTVVDTSATRSANDECTSTAMFVESRLRTYDEFKRQRMFY